MSARKVKNELKRFRKKLSRPVWFFLSMNKPWFNNLLDTQNEIEKLDPNPVYHTYKKSELWFWIKLLDWLQVDNERINFKKCLDIGSAFGTLSIFAKKQFNLEVYSIDLSKNINGELVEKYDINHEACNIEKDFIPWDKKFDCIFFNEILEHLSSNPLPVLNKIKGLLSDNGRIYLTTPDGDDYGRITDYFNSYKDIPLENEPIDTSGVTHIYHYTKEEMFELFEDTGLVVENFDYSPGITYRHMNFSLKIKGS